MLHCFCMTISQGKMNWINNSTGPLINISSKYLLDTVWQYSLTTNPRQCKSWIFDFHYVLFHISYSKIVVFLWNKSSKNTFCSRPQMIGSVLCSFTLQVNFTLNWLPKCLKTLFWHAERVHPQAAVRGVCGDLLKILDFIGVMFEFLVESQIASGTRMKQNIYLYWKKHLWRKKLPWNKQINKYIFSPFAYATRIRNMCGKQTKTDQTSWEFKL